MNEQLIKDILSKINDPDLKKDLVSLGFVKRISLNGDKLKLEIGLNEPDDDSAVDLKNEIAEKIKIVDENVSEVEVSFSQGFTEHGAQKKSLLMPGVKNTIAVASGKGGVGKSTVAVNLAAALAASGARVGLIDADIYGPSIPLMMGIKDKPKVQVVNGKNKLVPVTQYGIKVMSIGFLIDEKQAVVWRGPMASSTLKQFMSEVLWGELDFLLFDMPPGTGDIQLTLSQTLPLTGAVIVTTPQEIALADARKGHVMFEKVNVPTLGFIENMSYYQRDDGNRDYIFGSGGGEKLSEEYSVKLLGKLPINTEIRECGDEGMPVVLKHPVSGSAIEFKKIASELIKEINISNTTEKPEKNLTIEV